MNWKDWLLPWRAKAKIEQLQACLNQSADAAPFTAKIALLEERLEQTTKSLKAALDEKHTCATLLSSTRASEQDWRETASKLDLEKNELASLNRTLVDQLEHAKADVDEWKGKVKTERKQREDMEVALGKVEAELHEAHALAAKASELQEALDNEVKEHREAKQQLQGLTKWIRTTHRLDSVAPKGSIRNILQTSRFKASLVLVALLCVAGTAVAQAPFWRNSWSTNQAPPVIGTNLWISNTAQGQGWFFYNYPSSNAVARLRDITNAFTGLSASTTNFNGINVTNRALIGDLVVTNSGNTTNLTNWGHQVWRFDDSFGVWRNITLDALPGFGYPTFSFGFDNVLFADPANNTQGMLFGNINTNLGTQDIIVGSQNTANGDQDNVFGYFNYVSGDYSGAFGNYNYTTNNTNYVLGANVSNTVAFSVEIGPRDTNKIRISALGLDSLNLPVVGTNNTNFGNLAFPPQNTAVSTSSLAGAWNAYSSNGALWITQPCGGAGLMGIGIYTNGGGGIFAGSGGALRLGEIQGATRWNITSSTLYPSEHYKYDLGAVNLALRSGYFSNLYAINTVSSNTLAVGTNNPAPYKAAVIGTGYTGDPGLYTALSQVPGMIVGAKTVSGVYAFNNDFPTAFSEPGLVAYSCQGVADAQTTTIGVAGFASNITAAALTYTIGGFFKAVGTNTASYGVWADAPLNYFNGYVGIGTNSPQARLHIVAPGTATNQYVFRVSSSNAGVQAISPVTSDTNNVFRVGSVPLSIGQQVGLYGAMMFNNTNYGQAFGTTAYTNIVGFNIWNTNQFTVNTNTGYLTNKFAGYYRCMINLSMIGVNSGIYEGCMRTNDVDPETIAFKHQHDNPARLRSASGCGVIYLPAGTGCSFSMKCDVAGTIQIHRGSITIGTP